MAPETSDPPPEDDDIPVEEIVFSCCICQATISDVYATPESNQGFHSGSSSEDGIVTKFWITSCSHVTCSKHLENGTVPFHPKGEQPRAPCPKCLQDKNDDSPKDLFSLQGLNEGQYDPTIPEMWMHCPAIKLDDSIPGMDAVRFQYMAICHYGRQIRKKWKGALRKQSIMEESYSKERKTRRRLQSEQEELRQHVEALQKVEVQLKKWEDRKPFISHYMNGFAEMTKDNERMRSQLIELGYDVPVRKYLFEPAELSKSTQAQPENVPEPSQHQNTLATGFATVTARKSRHSISDNLQLTLAGLTDAERSSSARKRKRVEHLHSKVEQDVGQSRNIRRHSRDLMPPPLPRTKPAHLLPTFELSRNNRPEILQTQSVHSSEQQIRHPWQPSSAQRQFEQRDSSTAPYKYAMSQRQGQAHVDTSSGLQRQPQAFHQDIEPQKHFGHSGYVPQTRLDVNGYDAVSLAQLSLRSPDEDDFRPSQTLVGDRSDASRSRQPFPRQHWNWGNGLSEQQLDYYGLSPARYVDQRDEWMHRPAGSHVQSSMSAQAPQAIPQGQHTIASSPFFKRGQPDFRPNTMQRSQARNQAHVMAYDSGRGTWSETTAIPQNLAEFRGLNRTSYFDPPHRPVDHDTFYQRPQYHYGMAAHDQHSTMVPKTPRNPQGLLRRPDRPPSVVHRSPAKPEPRSYNKRITLPPSTGLSMPMAATQDEVLSQIRGVRGVSSHRHIPRYQPAAPNSNVARTLFSSGPRQSVRR